MRELAEQGAAIIFITHKLREVIAVCDTITVLRAGKVVGTTTPQETDRAGLANMMVGRSVVLQVEKGDGPPGRRRARRRGPGGRRRPRAARPCDGLDLEVRAGEIVGIAGVEGNGQRELVEALCGMRPVHGGDVHVRGPATPTAVAHDGQPHGRVATSPRTGRSTAFVGSYSVASNLVLERFDEPPYANGIVRDFDAVEANAAELVERFDVRPRNIDLPDGASLSGGNKQKVIVARELTQDAELVIAAQPTRGVDVGSIEFIHSQLVAPARRRRRRAAGVGRARRDPVACPTGWR